MARRCHWPTPPARRGGECSLGWCGFCHWRHEGGRGLCGAGAAHCACPRTVGAPPDHLPPPPTDASLPPPLPSFTSRPSLPSLPPLPSSRPSRPSWSPSELAWTVESEAFPLRSTGRHSPRGPGEAVGGWWRSAVWRLSRRLPARAGAACAPRPPSVSWAVPAADNQLPLWQTRRRHAAAVQLRRTRVGGFLHLSS